MFELDEAANRIREEVDPDANIIVGSTMDDTLGGMMRVSVVATGIDAVEVNTDIPVPRRSMSAPLTPQTVAEEAPVEVAEETPMVAEVAQAEDQAPLFEDLDVQRAAEEEQVDHLFAEESTDADDLPPPAYQPQVAAFEPRQEESLEAEPDTFVAPRAPAPGTPSPEALARLRAAAQKAAPEQQQAPAAAPQAAPQAEKPRFGINSLINRMTGHAEGEAQQRPARQQPQMQPQHGQAAAAPQPQETSDPDQERIEIPAFLRRQAN